MSRESLINLLRAQRAAIMDVLHTARVDERKYEPEGRWSIEGVLRHLMDFEADTIEGLDALSQGSTPAHYAIKDWMVYNAEQAAKWPTKPWGEVVSEFIQHRERLESRVEACTEEQLADPKFVRVIRGAVVHDFEHLPGIQERIALARGDVRTATVRWVEIARNELLALLMQLPFEAFDERLPEKWSIKEYLLHLADRDRAWVEIINRVSSGGTDEQPHQPNELHEWNKRMVARRAHWTPQQVLCELGEARGLWNGAMLAVPDWFLADARHHEWAKKRMKHDRMHLPHLTERFRNWRSRQA